MSARRRRFWGILIWTFALFVAIFSARYFLTPPPLLRPPDSLVYSLYPRAPLTDGAFNIAPHLFAEHRGLLRFHIACGIAAMVIGLFQFLARLRNARPAVHRAMGTVYVVACIAGGVSGFPLSFFLLGATDEAVRQSLYPTVAGFASLSVIWPCIAVIAFVRARQRRFDEHRAWMIRSYSLTFAAVTVRLVGIPLYLVSGGNVLFIITASIWSWTLNLVVAEWLIRRRPAPVVVPAPALAR